MPDFGFDDWMDAQLRNVPVPRELHARLVAARPESHPSDEQLDAALRNVPLPAHFERHLKRIARHNPAPAPWRSVALAASVLLVISAVTYLTLWEDTSARPGPAATAQAAAKKATSPQLAVRTARPRPTAQGALRRQQPVEVVLGDTRRSAQDPRNPLPSAFKQVANVGASIKEAVEAQRRAQSALGAGGRIERLPELDVFEAPLARGVMPPRNRGYDMLFHLRYGEHPFVSPAAHKDLQVSRVPFTFRTASYDLALAEVDRGRLPVREEVRVEDFLAAQHYDLPAPPAGGLALHAAASPSPLGEAGLHLLQLAVQGGKTANPPHQPTRLIAVVDTSSAAQAGARWKTVSRALATLGRTLAPGDRVTLIGFAEQPRVLAADATRVELEKLVASDALHHTTGSADILSAIQAACDAVKAVPAGEARRVVFITGRADFDDNQLAGAIQSLSQLAAANASWQLVRIAPHSADARLNALAEKARGRIRDVTSADELHAVLFESLAGGSAAVAHGVSMRITFNPKVVTSYRMLGHETATLTGESGDPLEVDFHAEQTATGMYELWLKPGADGDIAIAELFWNDPRSGHPRRSVVPIRRSQVARSFAQAPAWLQQGILAAKTAEFLRASYYVPSSRRLGQLLDLAAKIEPRAAAQAEFRELLGLIHDADKLR